MKASVLLIFLCLALTAYQYTENGRLKQLLFAQMVATSEAKSVLPAPTEPALEVPSADYEAQIPELRAEVVATAPSNVSEDQPNPFAGDQMREMMQNPAMKEMVRSQQKGMVESIYGDLVDAFKLGDDERKHFMMLLVEQQLAGMDERMQMMSVKTVKEREALSASIKEKKEAMTGHIKTFLNDEDDYARFEAYSDQMPERQQMTGLKAAMEAGGAPLDAENVEVIVDTMHKVRTNFSFDNDFHNQDDMDVSKFTTANVERFVEQTQEMNTVVQEQAALILNDSQLEIFKINQAQMAEMQKMSMDMAAKMFQQQQSMNSQDRP